MWSNQAPDTITIPGGAVSGARIVIDNTGIHAFNAADVEVITIQATDTAHGNKPDILIGDPTKPQMQLSDNGAGGSIQVIWPTTDYQFGGISLLGQAAPAGTDQAQLSLSGPRNVGQDYVTIQMKSGSVDNSVEGSFTLLTVNNNVSGPIVYIGSATGMKITGMNVWIDTHSGSNSSTFQIGSMHSGKQYYEEWGFSNLAIVSSSSLQVPASAGAQMSIQHAINDYSVNSLMNLSTAVWTSPDDGVYDIDFSWAWTPWVAGSRYIMFVCQNVIQTANTIMHIDETSTTGFECRHAKRFLAQNDTLSFRIAQVTGANSATVGNAFQSYISIKREF